MTPVDEMIGALHVQPEGALAGTDYDLDIAVVDDAGDAVASHIEVAVHLESYDEDAIVWRDGDPITDDGATRFGDVVERNDGEKHVVRTYTDGDGELDTLSIDRDPGPTDRLWHWVNVRLPSVAWLSVVPVVVGEIRRV